MSSHVALPSGELTGCDAQTTPQLCPPSPDASTTTNRVHPPPPAQFDSHRAGDLQMRGIVRKDGRSDAKLQKQNAQMASFVQTQAAHLTQKQVDPNHGLVGRLAESRATGWAMKAQLNARLFGGRSKKRVGDLPPESRVEKFMDGSFAAGIDDADDVVINSVLGEGTLREVAEAQGIPVITYEAGEALRFDESSIRAGVKGVLNIMHHLRMTGPRRTRAPMGPRVTNL